MKVAPFYLLSLVIYDILIISHFSIYMGIAPIYAFFVLSKERLKVVYWLIFLNIFILIMIASILYNKDYDLAILITLRVNFILLLTLSLFYKESHIFLAQAFEPFISKKLNTIIFVTIKIMGELKKEIQKIKSTLFVRGIKNSSIKNYPLFIKCYGFIIAKIICHSLTRSQIFTYTLQARGFNGKIASLEVLKISFVDYFLLFLAILGFGVGII